MSPSRFETLRPLLLAGLRRHHGFADAPRDIPDQWAAFASLLPLPGQVGRTTYGAMCGTDLEAQRFEYMTSVEVSAFDTLPEGMGRMQVPAAYYAVFSHSGPASRLHQTWAAIHAWQPGSGYQFAPTPDFERYGPGFVPVSGVGDVEIWVPVTPP
jgi:predicted transcriptional regulator YdeE